MSKNAQVRSKLLEIARILWLVSARTQICVLTVCQQQRWQVLEHCANSRVRASVGTLSVLTVDVGVPTLERTPCQKPPPRERRFGASPEENGLFCEQLTTIFYREIPVPRSTLRTRLPETLPMILTLHSYNFTGAQRADRTLSAARAWIS